MPRPHFDPQPAEPAPDPEALIERARRRARRRRAGSAAAASLALGGVLVAFFVFGGGRAARPRDAETGSPAHGLPQAGAIEETLRIPGAASVLFAARAHSLFVLSFPSSQARSVTVARFGARGEAKRRRLSFDLAAYLADLSAGRYGLYAGTAVIKRFTSGPDELIRLDPDTLRIRARRFFAASVATLEHGRRMWASLGNGEIVRLDPRTLALERSRRLISERAATRGAALLSKAAVGNGSLWVLAGEAADLRLVRLDPATLAIRSKTRVPTGGLLRQALSSLTADSKHVYLVGRAIMAIDGQGKLLGRPLLVPDLATAAVRGTGLVGLTNGHPALVLLGADGRMRARTGLADAGARIVVSGDDAWFLGKAGRGDGIVYAHLAPG